MMKFAWIVAVAAVVAATPAIADELVIRRPLFAYVGTLKLLTAGFEAATGDKIKVVDANDAADLLISFKAEIEAQVKDGKVDAGSVADIAAMRVGMAVKAGAPIPDISTPDKFKQALLAAKSVGVSRGPSGQYLSTELFPKLGIAEQIKDKTVVVTARMVGEAVASGEAEIGFQQASELIPLEGISTVGPIPESIQRVTIYTAGLSTGSKATAAGRRFIAYVKSSAAAAAYKVTGVGQVK